MPERTIAIARVPLARARARLVAAPALLLVAAGVAAAAGLKLGTAAGIALVASAAVLAVLSLYLAIILLSVRLDVEVASLRVRWIGGSRRYVLARGPVTRVLVRGDGHARLRPRFGALGWAIGPARLRGTEGIEVVRLAPTPTLILVPTDHGRLAIAATSEGELIAALGAAARVQQRLDAAAGGAAAAARRGGPPSALAPRPAPLAQDVRLMTGIERAQLEERLAEERAAALAAAEAERVAARAGAREATPAAPAAEMETVAATAREQLLPRRRSAARAVGIVLAGLPALAAGALWMGACVAGALPANAALRPVALATALAAAGLLGALIAARWFPRLLGLVSITSLAALVLIGRALIG